VLFAFSGDFLACRIYLWTWLVLVVLTFMRKVDSGEEMAMGSIHACMVLIRMLGRAHLEPDTPGLHGIAEYVLV